MHPLTLPACPTHPSADSPPSPPEGRAAPSTSSSPSLPRSRCSLPPSANLNPRFNHLSPTTRQLHTQMPGRSLPQFHPDRSPLAKTAARAEPVKR
eukprot:1398771-Pleurochrysis_carterae.AAC.1